MNPTEYTKEDHQKGMEIALGSVCEGKVTGITKFGAFVALPAGKTGMVHISEISHSYVNSISEHLKEGQEIKVKIIGIDKDGRINLSIKKAETPVPSPAPNPQRQSAPLQAVGAGSRRPAAGPATFEDKLKQFMQDSDSKISELKSYIDKKGGAGRRGGRRG